MLQQRLYNTLNQCLNTTGSCYLRLCRQFASKPPVVEVQDIDFDQPHTVVCSNGIVACWHPDPPFPYKHTRPIDLKLLKKEESTSSVFRKEILKEDLRERYKRGPRYHELQEIFYERKNTFYPRYREKKLYAVSAPIPKRK
ncbi:unnamed protein product [Enterobius vermicularis]|uniref:Large ribosomal subunit protein mL42 n=1 Tax=Enterobius vermicularis TaxID=51028 RepID=A0A0N4VH31_ENTVE|nr:unnamed protein product [Enterobius vermicularis]